MKYPANEDEFIKKWCDYIGESDHTDEEFATAFVHALNEAYKQGVQEGMRKAGTTV